MAYLAQGTVQIELGSGPACKVLFTTATEYQVTHRGKRYAVFVPEVLDDGDKPDPKRPYASQVWLKPELTLRASGPLFDMLRSAALSAKRVELKIEEVEEQKVEAKWAIVGATVPVPTEWNDRKI